MKRKSKDNDGSFPILRATPLCWNPSVSVNLLLADRKGVGVGVGVNTNTDRPSNAQGETARRVRRVWLWLYTIPSPNSHGCVVFPHMGIHTWAHRGDSLIIQKISKDRRYGQRRHLILISSLIPSDGIWFCCWWCCVILGFSGTVSLCRPGWCFPCLCLQSSGIIACATKQIKSGSKKKKIASMHYFPPLLFKWITPLESMPSVSSFYFPLAICCSIYPCVREDSRETEMPTSPPAWGPKAWEERKLKNAELVAHDNITSKIS